MLDLRPKKTRNSSRPRKSSKFKNTADCAACPCSWEDRSYEGECYDYGCVASKRMTGEDLICRAPDWIKRLVRKHADARNAKAAANEYEGMAEWFAESERKDEAMRRAITETFPGLIPGQNSPNALRIRYEEILKSLKEKENGP